MKNLVLTLTIISFIMLSCNRQQIDSPVYPVNVDADTLSADYLDNGFVQEGGRVITNNTDWNNLLSEMSNGIVIQYAFTQTSVDFNRYEVIAVFDSIFHSGGEHLHISSIVENANDISLTVDHLDYSYDYGLVRQPYIVVKIPASNKPVVFIDQ